MRHVISLTIALLLGTIEVHAQTPAPATAPSASAIRAGTYDLEIVYGGGTLEAKLELSAAGDSLVAKLFVGDHQSPVRAGARNGNKLALVSTTTAMDVGYQLEFDGDAVKGTFTYDNAPGTVTGKRRPGS